MISHETRNSQSDAGVIDPLQLAELLSQELLSLVDAAEKNKGILPGAEMILKEMSERYPGTTPRQLKRDFDRLLGLRFNRKEPSPSERRDARKLTPAELALAIEFGTGAVYGRFNALIKRLGCHLQHPEYGNCVFNILLSRLLPYGTTYVLYGSSSSGKSYVLKKAFSTLPTAADLGYEPLNELTSMSRRALNYLGNIANTILYLGEVKPEIEGRNDDEIQSLLRQLHSEGKCRHMSVEREVSSGPMKQRAIEVIGPCVQVSTTTKDSQEFSDENDNRTFWLKAEEDPRAVDGKLSILTDFDSEPWKRNDPVLQDELVALRLYWLSLKSYPIWFWYAKLIRPQAATGEELQPSDTRLYEHLKTFISCSALAHQHEREKVCGLDGVEYLVPTWEDYLLADRLLRATAPKTLETLPRRAKEAFERAAKKMNLVEEYKRAQLVKFMRAPEASVKKWIPKLIDAGWLVVSEAGRGNKPSLYKVGDGKHEFCQALNLVDPLSVTPEMVADARQQADLKLSQ